MKVIVNKKCIGCGVCTDIAQSAFEMIDGKSAQKSTADLTDRVVLNEIKMAADVCPVQAIEVKED